MNMNITGILQHKPKGTKLYSPIWGKVEFDHITSDGSIYIDYNSGLYAFSSDGKYFPQGECVLFPSKEMRDWSKFTWKKGDVLEGDGDEECIFDHYTDDTYKYFDAKFMKYNTADGTVITEEVSDENVKDWYLDLSKDAEDYIKEIEETFNGKLNRETLELVPNKPTKSKEPTPKFKPLDYVLSNDNDDNEWVLCQFSHIDKHGNAIFVGGSLADAKKVIPYNEKTAKLIGTNKPLKELD